MNEVVCYTVEMRFCTVETVLNSQPSRDKKVVVCDRSMHQAGSYNRRYSIGYVEVAAKEQVAAYLNVLN